MNTEVHDQWEDGPLVRYATQLAHADGDTSAAGILEQLLGLMDELEARFPGATFEEILADKAAITDGFEVRRLRSRLRKNGTTEADLALVCPQISSTAIKIRKDQLFGTGDPYDEQAKRL